MPTVAVLRFFSRFARLAGRILLVLYFLLGIVILAGRALLPGWILEAREAIAARVSAAIGLPVTIGGIAVDWPGLNPHLVLTDIAISDREGRPALTFARIEAELGLRSLLSFDFVFSRLSLERPTLSVRRDAEGRLFVAGLPLSGGEEPGLLPWLLRQGRISVRDARITWQDEMREAPPLVLDAVDLVLANFFSRHRFALIAKTPSAAAERLELSGEWRGEGKDWERERGRLYLELIGADLSRWRPWTDLPWALREGRGSARVWLEHAPGKSRLVADLAVADLFLRLSPARPELAAQSLSGRIELFQEGARRGARFADLDLATSDGVRLEDFSGVIELVPEGEEAGGRMSFKRLDLAAARRLAEHAPLPEVVAERLARFAPEGRLSDFDFSWRGAPDALRDWRIRGDFATLSFAPWREFPGVKGLSGHVEGNEREGTWRLSGAGVELTLPEVFPEPRLQLSELLMEGGWRRRDGALEIEFSRTVFANPEASGGSAHGRYRLRGEGLGEIDLVARIERASGAAVWRYLPFVVNPEARAWLKRALVAGEAREVSLRLAGPLERFPFRDRKSGVFQVKGRIVQAKLDYAPDWPGIAGIDGELLFEGPRMLIRAQRGEILGVKLANVTAEIPDLEAPQEVLLVAGEARGATQAFLDFIEKSPVGARIDHFTSEFSAQGDGALDLKLALPLRELAKSRVEGRFRFANNRLQLASDAPLLQGVGGEIAFTAETVKSKNLRGELFGTPISADLTSRADGGVALSLAGRLSAAALRQANVPLAEHLAGETSWRGTAVARRQGLEFSVTSDLSGLSSSLPEPFNKSALAGRRLSLSGRWSKDALDARVELAEAAVGRLYKDERGWRAAFTLGRLAKAPPALPEQGVAVAVAERECDADRWRALRADREASGEGGLRLARLDLSCERLRLSGRDFHALRLIARRADAQNFRIELASREAQGQLVWEGEGNGRLTGRLSRLYLTPSEETGNDEGREREPPALALVIDDFRYGERRFGSLDLAAEPRDGAWRARFEVKQEAARLTGTGFWRRRAEAPETRIDFRLELFDGEKFLAALALPDAVRGGRGEFTGKLAWPGSPFGFSPQRLDGELAVDLGRGQFKKLEPGVGRLLGVLSLQSLPRRITLDFRDVFSEGFAFDRLAGQARIAHGVMTSEGIEITGPAARVELSGRVDLSAETQELRVRVVPTLGETVATGALLVNPAVGAATWLAQKILKDPLGQIFAYEYAITGSWSDPQVSKLGVAPASP